MESAARVAGREEEARGGKTDRPVKDLSAISGKESCMNQSVCENVQGGGAKPPQKEGHR